MERNGVTKGGRKKKSDEGKEERTFTTPSAVGGGRD